MLKRRAEQLLELSQYKPKRRKIQKPKCSYINCYELMDIKDVHYCDKHIRFLYYDEDDNKEMEKRLKKLYIPWDVDFYISEIAFIDVNKFELIKKCTGYKKIIELEIGLKVNSNKIQIYRDEIIKSCTRLIRVCRAFYKHFNPLIPWKELAVSLMKSKIPNHAKTCQNLETDNISEKEAKVYIGTQLQIDDLTKERKRQEKMLLQCRPLETKLDLDGNNSIKPNEIVID